jgi:hypothetical protein
MCGYLNPGVQVSRFGCARVRVCRGLSPGVRVFPSPGVRVSESGCACVGVLVCGYQSPGVLVSESGCAALLSQVPTVFKLNVPFMCAECALNVE